MRLFATTFLTFFLLSAAASAQAPLVSIAAPGDLGFVEIHNGTDGPVDLTGYYLATTPDYHRIVDDTLADGAAGWVLGFPEGFVLPPGRAVVQIAGTVDDFVAAHGFAPEAVVGEASMGAVQLDVVSGDPADGLVGLVVLFAWDGASDLVGDSDMIFWGEGPRVDRNGVVADGPDDGAEASPYPPETAADDQVPAAAPEEGEALVRTGAEGAEDDGGSGLDGTDETSEDLSASVLAAAAVPEANVTLIGTVTADGAALDALLLSSGEVAVEVDLDDDGGFAVEAPANLTYVASVTEGDRTWAGELAVGPGSDRAVQLTLAEVVAFQISGTVTPDPSAPAPVADVLLVVEETGQGIDIAEDGTFAIAVASAGTYTLVATGPEIREARASVQVVDGDVTGVEIVVAAAHDLAGTVFAADTGEPLAGATVSIAGASQTTGAAGTWSLDQVAPGAYELVVGASGYETSTTTLEVASSQVVETTLTPVARYTLHVLVENEAGGPISGATVSVQGGEFVEPVSTETSSDGGASVGELRAGNYTIEVSAPGFADAALAQIPVRGDTEIAVRLVPDTRQPEVRTGEKFSCSTPVVPASPGPGLAVILVLGLGLLVRGSSRR